MEQLNCFMPSLHELQNPLAQCCAHNRSLGVVNFFLILISIPKQVSSHFSKFPCG